MIVLLLDGKTDWLVDEAGTIVLQCGLGNTLMTCMTCLAQSLWEETEKTVETKLLSKRLVHGNWVLQTVWRSNFPRSCELGKQVR